MIRIDIPNLDATVKKLSEPLRDMPKLCDQAVARAINRTLDAMRAEAIRIAKRAYVYVPPGRLFDQLYLRKAQRGALRGSLHISGERGIGLHHFRPIPKVPGTKPSGGVSALVRRGGQRKVYQTPGYSRPFIMPKLRGLDAGGFGVFERKNGMQHTQATGWKGFRMLFGASPIQSLQKKENQQAVADKGGDVFPRRLQHEIDVQLSKVMRAR